MIKEGLPSTIRPGTIQAMPLDLFFDYLGGRLNGPRAVGKKITINWNFTDTQKHYVLALEHSVQHRHALALGN